MLFRVGISPETAPFPPGGVSSVSGPNNLFPRGFSAMGRDCAREFTVYKKASSTTLHGNSAKNLIVFNGLRTHTPTRNLP